MKVIDSSGWIEFATDGPLAGRYAAHLKNLSRVVTPSIIVYEVYKRLKRDASEEAADAIIAEMGKTRIIPLDDQLAILAAETSLSLGLPMADAIVYTTAQTYGATLITSDADFKNFPRVIYLKN
ncbi:MAG: type II toxin-antitoxin system VapC family toxin [Elusimicrobia bacterium]|nr:type II toxin-antitoxin system VapC family toxin [Elusimicrobiota bacterium]